MAKRNLAVVTGASSGIGLKLARLAAANAYDLAIAEDEDLAAVADELRGIGSEVETVVADLATIDGVDRLCARVRESGRVPDIPDVRCASHNRPAALVRFASQQGTLPDRQTADGSL